MMKNTKVYKRVAWSRWNFKEERYLDKEVNVDMYGYDPRFPPTLFLGQCKKHHMPFAFSWLALGRRRCTCRSNIQCGDQIGWHLGLCLRRKATPYSFRCGLIPCGIGNLDTKGDLKMEIFESRYAIEGFVDTTLVQSVKCADLHPKLINLHNSPFSIDRKMS